MAGVHFKGGRICYANNKIMQKVDISFLTKSVIEAGKAIMQIKESGINTRYKEDMSPVTEADEVAEMVDFLVSDKASYVNGSTFSINGGLWMD